MADRSIPAALRAVAVSARAELVALVGDEALHEQCAAASFLLQVRASRAGFALDVAGGRARVRGEQPGHVWCEFGRWIVDLTATQFWRVPPVLVVPRTDGRFGHVQYRNDWVLGFAVRGREIEGLLARLGVAVPAARMIESAERIKSTFPHYAPPDVLAMIGGACG